MLARHKHSSTPPTGHDSNWRVFWATAYSTAPGEIPRVTNYKPHEYVCGNVNQQLPIMCQQHTDGDLSFIYILYEAYGVGTLNPCTVRRR
eukprot:362855-Chlamydomonas_euryale.AAC.5